MTALLSVSGFMYVLKWLHFFFGIMWIGHLYYFNFTQGAFMAEADAPAKSGVLTKLLPRALWWFRWGAMWTMVTGVLMFVGYTHMTGAGMGIFQSSWGVSLTIGSILGLTMWYNVWFIIWPNQQVVIKSAQQVSTGGAALPEAAASGAKALLASRTNVMFSIPMLFFMGAGSHLGLPVSNQSNFLLLIILLTAIWGFLEFNAIKGKLGPIASIKGVITAGFVLTAVILLVLQITL